MEPIDERPHEPLDDPDWEESWSFDALSADGTTLFVRLTFRLATRVAWYWAYLVEPGAGVLAVRDPEVPLPRGRSLEIRSDGLWADTICETPLEHWSLGLEAFGVRVDDPLDAFAGERGERTAFGLDVEWELSEPAQAIDGGYEQMGTLHGDVLVGARSLAFDAPSRRAHRWRPERWWSAPAVPIADVEVGSAVCIPLDRGVAESEARGVVHRVTPAGGGGLTVADIVVEP